MKLIFKIVLIVGLSWTKTINPINNYEIETLEIKGKERDYIILRNNEIIYEIEGPKLVVLHSRKPIPKRNQSLKNISFNFKLDATEYIENNTNYTISRNTKSRKHPAHTYSNSENLYINIPKGTHKLYINTEENPLLIRLTTKKKPKRMKSDIFVEDINNNLEVYVKTGKKSIPYSKIFSQNSVMYSYKEHGILWLYVRAVHNFDKPEIIPLILSFSNPIPNPLPHKIINSDISTKNIFYSEISLQSEIEGSSINVGKLRTYPISMFPNMGGVKIKNLSANDILIHGEFIPIK